MLDGIGDFLTRRNEVFQLNEYQGELRIGHDDVLDGFNIRLVHYA